MWSYRKEIHKLQTIRLTTTSTCYTVEFVTLAPYSEACLGLQTTTQSEQITVTLRDSAGNPVIASENYLFTLAFDTIDCNNVPYVDNYPVTINSGTSSTTYTNYTNRSADCGQGSCEQETRYYTGVSSTPNQLPGIQNCNAPSACQSYTASTSSGTGESYTYTDCNGVSQSDFVGGASGYDANTFCALSVDSYSSQVTITNNGDCV